MIMRKDLTDVGDADYRDRQSEFIRCMDCGMESGGTRGDFWELAMDTFLRCGQCGSENLAIVRKHILKEIIKE